jgi:hypothetical protein
MPYLVSVVRDASTGSFQLAMLIGARLLLAGALVNAAGIRNSSPVEEQASGTPSVSA